MNFRWTWGAYVAVVLGQAALGETASVKLKDIKTDDGPETTVVVKKGPQAKEYIEYALVEGTEEIVGDPGTTRKEALANWKSECKEWKQEVEKRNAKNEIIELSCGTRAPEAENTLTAFKSTGKYRIKTKVKEPAPK
jgi:hypothetical protein